MTLTRLGAAVAVLCFLGAAAAPAGQAGTPVAYCPLPSLHGTEAWGFHAGAPIKGSSGSYAHGHGSLQGHSATGSICQVDRVAGTPDRQIVLSVGHGTVTPRHAVSLDGVLGNEMRLPVRVASSTDSRCRVGTTGTVTLFASYNGIHEDSARFSLRRSCASHDHDYTGSSVVALVPR